MEQIPAAQLHNQEDLLSPDFLRKIEQLSLVAKRVFPGQTRGERRSTKRGASVEFADYRDYTIGDDFRRVDWNVYARLEKLFLKLYIEEEDLRVYLILDASQSMDFGNPSKLLYAKRAAAAMAYIALANFDRVGISVLTGENASVSQAKRGKQSAFELFDYLNTIQASGDTNLSVSLRDFCLRTSQPGIAIVVSDFLDSDYQKCIMALLSRKFEVTLLQVLDQDEVSPSIVGDLLLVDSETGEQREVTVTQALLRKYQQRFNDFCGGIEDFCMRYGCNYVRVTSQSPFEDLILNYLRQRGVVR